MQSFLESLASLFWVFLLTGGCIWGFRHGDVWTRRILAAMLYIAWLGLVGLVAFVTTVMWGFGCWGSPDSAACTGAGAVAVLGAGAVTVLGAGGVGVVIAAALPAVLYRVVVRRQRAEGLSSPSTPSSLPPPR